VCLIIGIKENVLVLLKISLIFTFTYLLSHAQLLAGAFANVENSKPTSKFRSSEPVSE